MSERAAWDRDGQPVNLPAAALDGLDWLRHLRPRIRPDDGPRNLDAAIERLEHFLRPHLSGASRAESRGSER